jgi:hypothetical protein
VLAGLVACSGGGGAGAHRPFAVLDRLVAQDRPTDATLQLHLDRPCALASSLTVDGPS